MVDLDHVCRSGWHCDLVGIELETHRPGSIGLDNRLDSLDSRNTVGDLTSPDLSLREEGLPGEPELIAVGQQLKCFSSQCPGHRLAEN